MNIFNPSLATLLIIALGLILASLASSSSFSSSCTKGLETVEKTRLGSTPPSCHNKCNECHPCFAVQVPTLPSYDRLEPTTDLKPSTQPPLMEFYHLPGRPGNRYSNYKPLGWKCRCNSHFFNP